MPTTTPETLTVGGQCEGYGGLFEALRTLLPVEHTWYAEIDPAASQVLAHHYPGVTNHGDITTTDWPGTERPHIFTSGFPCTDISVAGKREGSAGKNFLWTTGVIPAIRALMPPLVICENVPNLLRIEDGQVFARILTDLDRLGYTVSWTTIGACKVGACHHRHRVFIAATLTPVPAPLSDPVAHHTPAGWVPNQFVLFGDSGAVRWPASGFITRGAAWELPVETCGFTEPVPAGATTSLLPTPRTSDTNGAAGVHGTGGLDLRTAVAMLPTPMASDGKQTRTSPGDLARKSPALTAVTSLLPTPRASDGVKGGPNQRGSSGDLMLPAAVQPQRFGKYAAAVRRHELAYGLAAPDPTELGSKGQPRLAAAFPEFMMGLPLGWLTGLVDRNAALRLAGNGVNPSQAAYALSMLRTFWVAVAGLAGSSQMVHPTHR